MDDAGRMAIMIVVTEKLRGPVLMAAIVGTIHGRLSRGLPQPKPAGEQEMKEACEIVQAMLDAADYDKERTEKLIRAVLGRLYKDGVVPGSSRRETDQWITDHSAAILAQVNEEN